MIIIEKSCPNCGANLKLDKNAEKIKCEYCKKEYLVEEDKNDSLNVQLLEVKTFSKLFIIITAMVLIFIFFVGFMMAKHVIAPQFNNQTSSGSSIPKDIESIDEIPKDVVEAVHKASTDILKNDYTGGIYTQTEPYKNVGMYLVVYDGGTTLYDVYKAKYNIRESEKDVYAAIEFNDVNKNAYGVLVQNVNIKSDTFMVGFESMEELYKSIVSKVEYKTVLATDGMYMVK